MLKNSEMKANRFGRWAGYRKLIRHIHETLAMGGEIQLVTATAGIRFTAKHAGLFEATPSGAWVRRGKHREFIGLCKIMHFRPRKAA